MYEVAKRAAGLPKLRLFYRVLTKGSFTRDKKTAAAAAVDGCGAAKNRKSCNFLLQQILRPSDWTLSASSNEICG